MPKNRKRRGRGEGGVYQRDDGTWCGSVSLGFSSNGKRRRRVVYGETKAKVLERLDEFRQEVKQGLQIDPSRLTVEQFLTYWLDNDVKPNRAPGTYKSYSDTVRLHVNPYIGTANLPRLQADQVAGLYATLERKGVPSRTRELVHAVLHRALKRAVLWKKLSWNPAGAVERPKNKKKEIAVPSAKEALALLTAAADHRLKALFVLVVTTGLRQGEAFGLQWRDLDLSGKKLRVRHSLEELNGKLRLKEPKSEKSRRTVELPTLAVDALREHQRQQLVDGFYAPDKPVFTDTDGGWLRKSNFARKVFNPLRKSAGLPSLPFHGLRHFHASYQVEIGTSVKVLQERLGHADVGTTLRFYVHTREEAHREAADTFDTAFRKAGGKSG